MFKSFESKVEYFYNWIITVISKVKSDSKDIIMLRKISISNKYCSFELLKNLGKVAWFHKNIKQNKCFQTR